MDGGACGVLTEGEIFVTTPENTYPISLDEIEAIFLKYHTGKNDSIS